MLAEDFCSSKELHGNFMIVGDDMYLRDKVLSSAIRHLPEGIVEFNYNVIEGGKDVGKEIVDTLNMSPAISDIRIVYVKAIREKLSKESLEYLKAYLADPSPTSVLIVNEDGGMLSSLKKEFLTIDCNSYSADKSVSFVKSHTIELGGSINPAAARLLSEYCAYDMMRIDAEIRKLIEYKEGETITEIDVADLVHADVDYEIYEIANAVGDRNMNKALEVIGTLLAHGLKPFEVLSQLSRAFRRMLYVKLSPLGDDELGKILEVKPFAIKKLRDRVGKFTPVKLKDIYDNINDMEFKFKSGVMSDASALDDALVKIFA